MKKSTLIWTRKRLLSTYMFTLVVCLSMYMLTGCGRAIYDTYDRFTGNPVVHVELNTLFKNISLGDYTGESVPIKAIAPIGAIEAGGGE